TAKRSDQRCGMAWIVSPGRPSLRSRKLSRHRGGCVMAELEKTTPAHRFGAWAGLWWRRWRALEERQLERVQGSDVRYGRLLVRCVFRGGDILILAVLLLAGYVVVLPVLLAVVLAYLATGTPKVDIG